jgi:hypothetical protein
MDFTEIAKHDRETLLVAERTNDRHGHIVEIARFDRIEVDVDRDCGPAEHRARNTLAVADLAKELLRLAIAAVGGGR